MDDQAGWRAWSGAWKVGAPPEDWWLSADGRWYPPGVQRPPGGPTWRGSAAEYRPRQFAEAGARTAGGVSVVTRSRRPGADGDGVGPPATTRHARRKAGPGKRPPRAGSARAEVGSLVRTTIVLLAAALAAVTALALWSMRDADDTPDLRVDTSLQTTTTAPAPTVLPDDAEVQRVPSA